MRILLTEGSGLTSRQVATRLGELGHEVEVLSSTRLCLTRFTRYVRRVHTVPPFGLHPLAWLDAACSVALARHVDMLFPTQEQVAVLSACESQLDVRTIVPPFGALRQVQDKHAAFRTLAKLGLPQPPSVIAIAEQDLLDVRFPVFVKRAVSTASTGVRRATGPTQLLEAVRSLGLVDEGVLVQRQVDGRLAMVQAVADRGQLVAWHANLRVREGVNGGASFKESIDIPDVAKHLETLIAGLRWHGPISLDAILTSRGPVYIDINPRLVEPQNAWLAGVDLVGTMLALACGEHPAPSASGRAGVHSHQLLLAVLGAAQTLHGRRAVLEEIVQAALHKDGYSASTEELTPTRRDPLAAIPVAAAAVATLVWPRSWRWFVGESVSAYALTPEGWAEIVGSSHPG